MMELSRAEYIAVRMMLAYLDPDTDLWPVYIMAIESESGLAPEAFDIASVTAWEAAQFWWKTDPDRGRKLLQEKLYELTGVPA
ncbi:MAG: hypothetical protein JST91_29675 [Actinobacteria bacterium]|nr:hypothetical protein [Actinomycetota bacterium]